MVLPIASCRLITTGGRTKGLAFCAAANSGGGSETAPRVRVAILEKQPRVQGGDSGTSSGSGVPRTKSRVQGGDSDRDELRKIAPEESCPETVPPDL